MTRSTLVGGAFAVGIVLLALVSGRWAWQRYVQPETPRGVSATAPRSPAEAGEVSPWLLYGRVTTADGTVYEGRLRFGGVEETLWSHTFNGTKKENPWAAHVPPERLPTERVPVEIFGFRIAERERPVDLGRPFMVRFGDIRRIDAPTWWDLRVTLKSGAVFELERFEADDFADGVRVWDATRGVVNLGERQIRSIEFLSPAPSESGSEPPQEGRLDGPRLLHGTVHARQGEFTGFLQWDRRDSLDSDTLDGERSVRFDTIRSITRHSPDSVRVTLRDGGERVLTGSRDTGRGHRGVYVDDPRVGRVLISWRDLERVDLHAGDEATESVRTAPAYDDFPPGRSLTGSVTLRDGRRLAGRLIFDLDESDTSETLDAPAEGVDYSIPFGRIAAITPPEPGREDPLARVLFHDGGEIHLESAGDLGVGNAGLLIFDDDGASEYLHWDEVTEITLDRPPEVLGVEGVG